MFQFLVQKVHAGWGHILHICAYLFSIVLDRLLRTSLGYMVLPAVSLSAVCNACIVAKWYILF